MTTRSLIADATALTDQAKALTARAMEEVGHTSVAWTFLLRAYDELGRAITTFAVATNNIDKT